MKSKDLVTEAIKVIEHLIKMYLKLLINFVSLYFSVYGPQGLQMVQVTDVSLLVEWESVRRAEYYVLTYHPKDDESALQLVLFFFLGSISLYVK